MNFGAVIPPAYGPTVIACLAPRVAVSPGLLGTYPYGYMPPASWAFRLSETGFPLPYWNFGINTPGVIFGATLAPRGKARTAPAVGAGVAAALAIVRTRIIGKVYSSMPSPTVLMSGFFAKCPIKYGTADAPSKMNLSAVGNGPNVGVNGKVPVSP